MTRDEEDAVLSDTVASADALRKAARSGLMLNTLFQSDGGRSRAAFKRRDGDRFTYFKFAVADTAGAALQAALALATDTQPSPDEGSVLD